MFGGFHSWFSTHLAGLDTVTSADSTGWRHIIAAPIAASILRLKSAAISVNTRFGMTVLSWSFQQFPPLLTMNVTVPIGSIADTYAPSLNGRPVTRMEHSTATANNEVGSVDMLLRRPQWTSLNDNTVLADSSNGVMEVSEEVFRATLSLRIRVGSGHHQLVFYY